MARRRAWTGLLAGLLVGPLALVSGIGIEPGAAADPVEAQGPCARWASTTGHDDGPGTQAAPYRSLGRLAAALDAGEVGCLPAGQTYFAIDGNGIVGNAGGTSAHPIVITSGPGGRAEVRGQLWFQESAHDVALVDLDLHGSYGPGGAPVGTKNTFLIVHGDRIRIANNDITNGRGICIGVGKGNAASAVGNVLAEDVVITGNRIHGCGMDPSITWSSGDSGAHGVYLEYSHDAVVTQNLIYDNRYRGLQLWPRNDGAEIAHNLFDTNATQVNIGSSEACGGTCRRAGFRSVDTDVHDNIFSNRVTDWRPSQNPSQVYGYFLVGSPDYGNDVHHNCFAPGDAAATGDGFGTHDNRTEQTSYVDRAGADFRLKEGSGCIGLGPAAIQPGVVPPDDPAARYRPDAQVRVGHGRWIGAGVIGVAGARQTVTVRVRRGARAQVQVRVRNAGTASDSWSLAEAGAGGARVGRSWWSGAKNITRAIDNGVLGQHHVGPGATRTVRLRVHVAQRARIGSVATWYLHAVHDPANDAIRDVVRIRVRVVR